MKCRGTSPGGASKSLQGGCTQCAHPGLRIRLYGYRNGPEFFAGGVADFQEEEADSSATSGTVLPQASGFSTVDKA